MRFFLAVIFVFVSVNAAQSAQEFTLRQCIDYAFVNNSNIKMSKYDVNTARRKVQEQIGTALPQVTASGGVTDNLELNTTLMPGQLFGYPDGTFIPLKNGTQYSVSTGVDVDQKIFDASFWVGLKSAKISSEQAALNLRKTKESTGYSVCTSYFKALILVKKCDVLKEIADAAAKTLESTQTKFDCGAAKKIDVDKIRVTYHNDQSQYQQMELSFKQAMNNLKYAMGMPVDSNLSLADTSIADEAGVVAVPTVSGNAYEDRTDYQLEKVNLRLEEAGRNKNIAGYMPSLSFTASYSYKTMPDELTLRDDWYESSSIGLNLNIPIFDGFQRHAKVLQSKYGIEKAMENIRYTEQSIKLDISNYETALKDAVDNIKNEKENLELARGVYANMQLSYRQGTGSFIELVDAENSLREAQNNYFDRMLSLYNARIDLEQASGTLIKFMESIK